MKDNELNEPAFPVTSCAEHQFTGMTLRDYFAGKALNGMLANQHPYVQSDEHMFARDSYKLADAMLKARAQSTATVGMEG